MSFICKCSNCGKKKKSRRFLKKGAAFFFCALFLWEVISAFAQIIPIKDEKDLFFSVQRIFLKGELVARLQSRDDGRAQKDIAEFAGYYREGLIGLSKKNFSLALEDLFKARLKWPEYFYTDFAIALTYEEMGEYLEAARYYKSYLNKLMSYQNGHYGISAPLIVSFSSGRVEDHDYAYGAVKKRLSERGINIGSVRPAYSSKVFPEGIALFVLSLAAILAIFKFAVPFVKKKIREKNPPEGFWVCPNCGAFVPDLSFECSSCGKARPLKYANRSDGGER